MTVHLYDGIVTIRNVSIKDLYKKVLAYTELTGLKPTVTVQGTLYDSAGVPMFLSASEARISSRGTLHVKLAETGKFARAYTNRERVCFDNLDVVRLYKPQ